MSDAALASRRNAGSADAPRRAGGAHRPRLSLIGIAQIAAALLITVGWLIRDERWMIPDRGVGYGLGIVGLAAMVMLLVYPLRKHLRPLRRVGRISSWFQFHMLLGLLGPVAILYHANFRLGSTNATVAMFCVLTVAGSGVVGRVLYVRIHAGLEGRRRTLDEIREQVVASQQALARSAASQEIVARLAQYEREVLGPAGAGRTGWFPRLGSARAGRQALRDVQRLLGASGVRHAPGDPSGGAAWRAARRYVAAVRSVIHFRLWERLFALWHVAHLPLSFLLFATAAVHVVAVHLY